MSVDTRQNAAFAEQELRARDGRGNSPKQEAHTWLEKSLCRVLGERFTVHYYSNEYPPISYWVYRGIVYAP